MNKYNNLSDLVIDLFYFFRKEYKIKDDQIVKLKKDGKKESEILFFKSPGDLYTAALVLTDDKIACATLQLVYNLDPEDDCCKIEENVLLVSPVWKRGLNLLHIDSGQWLGGFPTMLFNDSDIEHDKFVSGIRCQLISKAHELFYSGDYNIGRFCIYEKMSAA